MQTLCIIFAFLTLVPNAFAQLDLHAHLVMKPGLGPLFGGEFEEAPLSDSWISRLKMKASASSLQSPQAPRLIVASFYAHPFFSNPFHFDVHQNIHAALDEEYRILHQFVEQNSKAWVIAKTPLEARAALLLGKRVLVLSIEGADQVLETEDDFKKWIDTRGIAIVTPFHLTEDHFGGAAFILNRFAWLNSPLNLMKSLLITQGSCILGFCKSPIGLKPDGISLIHALFKRHVWIDLAHANEMEVEEILPEMSAQKLPLLVTHTEIREVYPAERGLGSLEAQYLAEHGGMIGLIPSMDMMTRNFEPHDEASDPCASGLLKFKKIFQYTQKQLGEMSVAIGSDVNAPLNGLSGICTSAGDQNRSTLEKNGYFTYSQLADLTHYVTENPKGDEQIVNRFLYLWEQARQNSR